MCLIRLVNGLLDKQQGKIASSLNILAENINLPRELVDLRHTATHNQLPSAQLLQYNTKLALNWLQVHYWEQQEKKLNMDEKRIKKKLTEFKRLMREHQRTNSTEPFPSTLGSFFTSFFVSLPQHSSTTTLLQQTLLPSLFSSQFLMKIPTVGRPTIQRVTQVYTVHYQLYLPFLTVCTEKYKNEWFGNVLSYLCQQLVAHEKQSNPNRWLIMLLSCWLNYFITNLPSGLSILHILPTLFHSPTDMTISILNRLLLYGVRESEKRNDVESQKWRDVKEVIEKMEKSRLRISQPSSATESPAGKHTKHNV